MKCTNINEAFLLTLRLAFFVTATHGSWGYSKVKGNRLERKPRGKIGYHMGNNIKPEKLMFALTSSSGHQHSSEVFNAIHYER